MRIARYQFSTIVLSLARFEVVMVSNSALYLYQALLIKDSFAVFFFFFVILTGGKGV